MNRNPTTITKKDMILMDHTASSVKVVLGNVRVQLQILDDDIKADLKSKAEYEKQLKNLENRKADLLARIKSNNEWLHTYNNEVGPFAEKYKNMTSDIQKIYGNAKKGHAAGIQLLEKEFGYHPIFKRPLDTFSATTFTPS